MTAGVETCRLAFALSALTAIRAIGLGFGDVAVHAGELVFGFMTVQLLGFLSVSLPRWLGRPIEPQPVVTVLLAGHAAAFLWGFVDAGVAAEGRSLIGALTIAIFLGNAIAAGRFAALPVLLAAAVHAGAGVAGAFFYWPPATMTGLAAILFLCIMVSDRIGLALVATSCERAGRAKLPPPPAVVHATATIAGGLALAGWAMGSGAAAPALVSAVAGTIWMAMLQPWRIGGEAGVVILLVGMAWKRIAFGLLFLDASGLLPMPQAVVIHAFAVGGLATLAVGIGTSIIRKRDGRAMMPSRLASAIYGLIAVAALLRVAAAAGGGGADGPVVLLARTLWTAAFAGVIAHALRGPLGPTAGRLLAALAARRRAA